MTDQCETDLPHLHIADEPWCDWCDALIDDEDTVHCIEWEMAHGSTMIAKFCSEKCAEDWGNATQQNDIKEMKAHA